ncbi:MAG: B12-binding domain-containing radical SAM protein [Sandaracinaceae bacterium]
MPTEHGRVRPEPGVERILLVYPRFTRNNLLGFEHMMPLFPGKKAVLPPLGLLELGALFLGEGYEVRFVDENVGELTENDWRWADLVGVSGMHPQRPRIQAILDQAHARGLRTMIGGPSASICPEYYPTADAVHVGEIGDGTDALLAWIRSLSATRTNGTAERTPQVKFVTENKTDLEDLPLPALELIDVNAYFIMPLQFSVGCPYTCEFCDIPAIYGRIARVKSAERVVTEMQQFYDHGFVGTVLFVDDNLIANKKALRKMLPGLAAWQEEHQYPYPLTSEATINLSREPEILELLQAARFTHMFVGVESPDPSTLKDISKKQNTQDPIVDSIRILNSYGLEVIMGMILGFDTDTEKTGDAVREFIRESNVPIVYFNLLAALPKTALWDRLEKEGRIITGGEDATRSDELMTCMTSNVKFKLPLETVQQMLRDTVSDVYSPKETYRRFRWNAENVYGKQIQGVPPTKTRAQQLFAARFAIGTLTNVIGKLGVVSRDRGHFWRFVADIAVLKAKGDIESFLEVLLRCAPDAEHLVTWGRVLHEEHGAAADVIERPVEERREPLITLGSRRRDESRAVSA